jgi:hypothetical protein
MKSFHCFGLACATGFPRRAVPNGAVAPVPGKPLTGIWNFPDFQLAVMRFSGTGKDTLQLPPSNLGLYSNGAVMYPQIVVSAKSVPGEGFRGPALSLGRSRGHFPKNWWKTPHQFTDDTGDIFQTRTSSLACSRYLLPPRLYYPLRRNRANGQC